MKIGIAQINTTVGDLTGNAALIFNAYEELVAQGADLVMTPELALTGYPPQDLLFAGSFVDDNLKKLAALEKKIGSVPLLVGFVDRNKNNEGKPFYNAAAVLREGAPRFIAHKRLLPTYDVFEEARYFEPGCEAPCFSYAGTRWGITICEDLWTPNYLPRELYYIDPAEELLLKGAEIILNLSASPFQMGKPAQRLAMLQAQARRLKIPVIYCNAVGANDQLIFDGHSLIITSQGQSIVRFPGYREEKKVVDLSLLSHETTASSVDFFQHSTGDANDGVAPNVIPAEAEIASSSASLYTVGLRAGAPCPSSPAASFERSLITTTEDSMQELHDALVLGLRDYLRKCGFKGALLGLSGGIDSAVVATLAVAALGPENVQGVLMPGPYSSQGSIDDATALVNNLSIPHLTLPITPLYDAAKKTVHEPFLNLQEDSLCISGATEENLQARLRAVTLMALSNKFGTLLLTTGNKSELAVGYCTLYGDMCGGLAVIADVPKTVVYKLAHWINRTQEIIPWNSIYKAPSAELRPNQKDQDTLPPYEILDAILTLLLEEHQSLHQIIDQGFDKETVHWIARHVYRNEYKRQQAAPGLKVTGKAFGLGRRFPIAQRYLEE
jgi:NAD+ synthase (glutamine-hydrolysing)